MRSRRWTRLVLLCGLTLLSALVLFAPAALAQGTEEPAQTEETDDADDSASRRDRKQAAKERRIEEYLRKREEKLERKEQARGESEPERSESAARNLESKQLSGSTSSPAAETSTWQKPAQKKGSRDRGRVQSDLPRELARAQKNVRETTLGQDPTVREYLALIEQQQASPQQLAAFGNFLAQNGLTRDALEYYAVALRLEDQDPVLWINMGTLHQQVHDLSAASSAYGRALDLSPNNALAHYNLGSVLNELNRYDDALAAYKTALVLDPSLGDPTRNPQAANNTLLTAVKLMLYREQVGNLSLPLIDIPTGEPRDGGSK